MAISSRQTGRLQAALESGDMLTGEQRALEMALANSRKADAMEDLASDLADALRGVQAALGDLRVTFHPDDRAWFEFQVAAVLEDARNRNESIRKALMNIGAHI